MLDGAGEGWPTVAEAIVGVLPPAGIAVVVVDDVGVLPPVDDGVFAVVGVPAPELFGFGEATALGVIDAAVTAVSSGAELPDNEGCW